jgi:RimJ/RimL family protein N-acetyltransferase
MTFELTEPLMTERLLLRPFSVADFDSLFAYRSLPEVTRYLLFGPQTHQEVRETLERKIGFRSIASEGDVLALALELRETGDMVGDFILQLVSRVNRTAEIGYIIHPDHQGHGYATEGGRAVLGIAFRDLGLHRVIGRLDARNDASAQVLEKLGMRREAHFVDNDWLKDEWQSEVVYAILEHEWKVPGAIRG